MSKAFTRESDVEETAVLPARAPLPPGITNYITAAGAERLRNELQSLTSEGRDREATPSREGRIRQLQEIVRTMVVAESPADRTVVRFGAAVTLERRTGVETYRLVGVDETDLDRDEISWLSPLGKVLLGKREGDRVRFQAPAGFEELKVLKIAYESGLPRN